MARQYAREGRFEDALHDLDELDAVAADDRRRGPLRVVLLRRLGRLAEADATLSRLLAQEHLNPTLTFLESGGLPSDGHLALDVALELAQAGEDDSRPRGAGSGCGARGERIGKRRPRRALPPCRDPRPAGSRRRMPPLRAPPPASVDRRWCFPAGLDDHDALLAAVRAEDDPVAASLLGMLLFDVGRREDALALWEAAIRAGGEDPLLHRNAGLASYNVAHDDARAVEHYEQSHRTRLRPMRACSSSGISSRRDSARPTSSASTGSLSGSRSWPNETIWWWSTPNCW